jgi:hypothetical protein
MQAHKLYPSLRTLRKVKISSFINWMALISCLCLNILFSTYRQACLLLKKGANQHAIDENGQV